MRTYEILDLAGMRERRTVADALAILEAEAGFGEEDKAETRVGLVPLRPGQNVGLVQVVFDVPCSVKSYSVPLPSAEFFYAYSAERRRERYPIPLLDRGIVDARGVIALANRQTIRSVEIEPARLPLDPTDLDWRIVHVAVECCRTDKSDRFSEREVDNRCYRPLRKALRPEDAALAYMVPDERWLDCSALTNLWVPCLDSIAAYWAEVYPHECPPSMQKIANTLADFRMRFPRP